MPRPATSAWSGSINFGGFPIVGYAHIYLPTPKGEPPALYAACRLTRENQDQLLKWMKDNHAALVRESTPGRPLRRQKGE